MEEKFTVNGRCRLDWMEMAKRKIMPRFDAVVFLLDGLGRRVFNSRGYVKTMVTLTGQTRDAAILKLDRKTYEFCRWFDFPEISQKNSFHDAPGCDVADQPDAGDGQNLEEYKKSTNVKQ